MVVTVAEMQRLRLELDVGQFSHPIFLSQIHRPSFALLHLFRKIPENDTVEVASQ